MAGWITFRADEDEAEDETGSWKYDSTWEEDDDEEEEEEDGGGDEGGDVEAAEEATEEEPEDAGEQPGWVRGSRQVQEQRPNSSPFFQRIFEFSGKRNWHAARDLQRYRHCYPGLIEQENEEESMWNLSFYKNEISFMPQGLHIDVLLESWWDNYEILEENHSYIQWLFPLREHGMNRRARPLTCQEIQAFKKSKEVMQRFVRAYQLMLRFYGIVLTNKETGELQRAENWAERFQNLNRFSHNNLRITRILKCLGEMGYEHYQVHLVKFFLTETLVKKTLPNVKKSALDYFLFTIRNKKERRELVHYAWQHFKPQDRFVWGPHDKLLKYKSRSAKSQLHQKAEEKQETPATKHDGSVQEDQNQSLEEEQKAGDAADAQDEANLQSDDVKEKRSECVLTGGDGEEEKEASFTQQEEKDLNSEAEGAQGAAESDCTKESKKRKLEANVMEAPKSEALRSPPDIENISRNLGECAIDAGSSSFPLPQAEEDQEAPKGEDVNTKEPPVPEIAVAAVKRRKVDQGISRRLAINLPLGPPASRAKLNPSVANTEAEKEDVSEKNTGGKGMSEKGGGDANGGTVSPSVESRLPEAGRTSPLSDGSEAGGDEVTARSDEHHCNSTLLRDKSEVDGVEQHEKAESASEEVQAEVPGKKEVPECPERSVAPVCPEEDSAEVATQKPESSECGAEPDEEQVAAH